jgi:tetratricopeptide (TPR) repeat protein
MPKTKPPVETPLSPLVQHALAASAQNECETALRLYAQAIREEAASAVPHFLMGGELAQLGRIAEAEAAYANALLLAPTVTIIRFELGALQFTSARAAVALLTWQPLLALPDTEPLKLFVRGYAALAQDDFDQALRCFKEGIAANQVNAPLNGNIQLLIDEILRLRESQAVPTWTSGVSAEASPEETEQMHFLLSNYKNQGTLH